MANRKNSSIQKKQSALHRSKANSLSIGYGRILAGIAFVVFLALLVYFPSLKGGFLMDDDGLLTENHLIKASDGLRRFWFTAEPDDYWPVANSSLWLEWRIWKMNPIGYRATNLSLHIVESLLLWWLLCKLSIPGAFLAALIFAVHPVNVESVAWIAQRKDMLAMLFFLLSMLWYLEFMIRAPLRLAPKLIPNPQSLIPISSFILHPSSFYCLSLAAFILAMLSKGSAAVLPVMLLGIVWWLGDCPDFSGAAGAPCEACSRWSAKMGLSPSLLRLVPFFVVSVIFTIVNIWFQTHGQKADVRNADILERLLGAGGVIWFYLYKAFFPLKLIFVYPNWKIHADSIFCWLPLTAAIIVTAILWLYRDRWSRALLFAWGFFCTALIPVLGLIDVGFMRYSLVADHYQHIAIIAPIALVCASWTLWHRRLHSTVFRLWATAMPVAAVAILALLCWRQNHIYCNAKTLYQDTLKKNPACWMAHNNLGFILKNTGQLQKAFDHYSQALALNPNYAEAHNNLGGVLLNVGRLEDAIKHFKLAIQLRDKYAKAIYNLGYALQTREKNSQAIACYRKALEIDPYLSEAYNNLGMIYLHARRFQEAIAPLQQVLRIKPDSSDAHSNYGAALVPLGRYAEAIVQFQQALKLNPHNFDAWNNLGLVYVKLKRPNEAAMAARKAIEEARAQGQEQIAKTIEAWLNSLEN